MQAELFILIPFSVILSLSLTWLATRYALSRDLIDIPNSRSSHVEATPRGGGIAIAVVFLASLVILFYIESAPGEVFYAIAPAAVAVAIVGFWDDHGHVLPVYRLIVHIAAVAWVFFVVGLDMDVHTPVGIIHTDYIAAIIAGLFMVWFINLFNFMDGIDGIAACEAIFITIGGIVIAYYSGYVELVPMHLILVSACAGFLVWNWPPARIFMGDVGSGFLGIVLAAFAYLSIHASGATGWSWLILPAVFVSDSTITLLRRMFSGETWYRPHRSHAYQKAAKKWGHKPVVVVVSMVNILWVMPMAYLAIVYPEWGIVITLIAYMPITLYLLLLPFEKQSG